MEDLFVLVPFAISVVWLFWRFFLKKTFLWHRLFSSTKISDEAYYEQASSEIRNGVMREGLWAKAWAETQGDTLKAQALYVKLRVASMKDEVAHKFSGENAGRSDAAGNSVVQCSKCGGSLRIPFGKLLDVRCPKCGHEFRADTRNGIEIEEFDNDSFIGRIGRMSFLGYSVLTGLAAALVSIWIEGKNTGSEALILALLCALALVSFYCWVTTARLHDINRSSGFAFLCLIPILNFVLFFVLLFVPGTPHRNRYGHPDTGLSP
jgi:uncharacterized membrane protein YhaH (DUF805 family)